jgi:hypothetical protein
MTWRVSLVIAPLAGFLRNSTASSAMREESRWPGRSPIVLPVRGGGLSVDSRAAGLRQPSETS